MKALRHFVLSAALIGLSGCTVYESFNEVKALNETQAVGSPFTQALAGEYRGFANSELKEMMDFPDSLHFARKGLAATAGQSVLPEPVTDWNLDEQNMQELGTARGRLIVALDQGARETNPAAAARAQARFDCWIEQQEEDSSGAESATCKNDFTQAMSQIEASQKLPPPPVESVSAPLSPFDVDAARPMQAENAMYLAFFDWDKAELDDAALKVLDALAQEIKSNPPGGVNVVGHADTSGSKKYNQRLALKRANNARNALLERGVDANLIRVDARGEEELLVPTADDVREPANRRVNVSFE